MKEKTTKFKQIVFRIDEDTYQKVEELRVKKVPYMKMNAFVAYCVYQQLEWLQKDKEEK